MTTGWVCLTFWIASNVALAAWRIYVTRALKVATEPGTNRAVFGQPPSRPHAMIR
jgi:hypothetical protein